MWEEWPPRSYVGALSWLMTIRPIALAKSDRASPLAQVVGEPQLGEWALKSPATMYSVGPSRILSLSLPRYALYSSSECFLLGEK